MRKRPFSVEQMRRHQDLDPAIRWRRLVTMCRQLGAAAEIETRGAQPDPSGVARWSLIDFANEISLARRTPFALQTPEGARAAAMLIFAAKAFRDASPRGRRSFARPLIAVADLVDDLMGDARP
ncbi:hypothetical protein CA606_18120 [Caulobacter vibrioides]|uniref:Uncharacterized protein n=1 Tax=Caulobacter vibrioides TaxID=155892 RepID=A0A290MQ04_CAUVI|nr:hypothetical protein [Caulobacter vibrioides]ATC34091.1 hypothetical protein CA606_18120 [Caulobacter vibrioides]